MLRLGLRLGIRFIGSIVAIVADLVYKNDSDVSYTNHSSSEYTKV